MVSVIRQKGVVARKTLFVKYVTVLGVMGCYRACHIAMIAVNQVNQIVLNTKGIHNKMLKRLSFYFL